jgi:hypothetical protein
MSDLKVIRDSIREISKEANAFGVICTVKSVDSAEKICICTPVDDSADILEVKLMAINANGFYVLPKVGSYVIVSLTSPSTGHIAMFSEVEEIHLNGDNFGGLTKLEDVVTKLNNLENALNSHILLYNTHLHATAAVGPPVPPTVPDTQTPLVPTVNIDLENTTVKQGDGS